MGIGTEKCGKAAPDKIDRPNRLVPIVVDERLIVRLFDVHSRELEELCEESISRQ